MKDSIHLDFHFVDGPLSTSAAAGIDLFYGPPYYAFWEEENATETQAARTWLADLIAESGPFDGVMMFSQGCILGASMLLRHQIQNPHQPPPFKFAIFICGGAPLREMESLGYSITPNVWERDRLSKYALHYKAGLSAILSQGSARWTEVDTSITAEDLAEEITARARARSRFHRCISMAARTPDTTPECSPPTCLINRLGGPTTTRVAMRSLEQRPSAGRLWN